MAVTVTDRLQVTRWSSGLDAFTRTQMDDSHAALEARAAGFLRGTAAARPAASAALDRFLYFSHDTGVTEMCVDTTGAGVYEWRGFVMTHGATMTGRLILKGVREAIVVMGTSGTLTLNPASGTYFTTTPTAAVTVAFGVEWTNGDTVTLHVNTYGAGFGGVTQPAGVMWPEGVAPTIGAASGHHFLTYTRVGGEDFGFHSRNVT